MGHTQAKMSNSQRWLRIQTETPFQLKTKEMKVYGRLVMGKWPEKVW